MTDAESRILEEFARRFPASAHAAGGRNVRLGIRSGFPQLDRRKPDEYESFLEAAESLERAGIVSLVWAGRYKGEELSAVVLQNPEELYTRLGRLSPRHLCDRSRQASLECGSDIPFFDWMARNLSPKDLDASSGEPLPETISDAARLARTLISIARGEMPPKLTRALSVELFSDSKRIERILRSLQPLLNRAERAGIALPPYELADRSYPETFIAGKVLLQLHDGGSIENNAGCILGIPFETAIQIASAESLEDSFLPAHRRRLLSIENKENFFDLATRIGEIPFDALLYSGGHPNRAVQILARSFAESGWNLFHSGDLDPDGILILQELSDAACTRIAPWMMDCAVFDRYRMLGKPLEAEAHRRALLVRDDTRKRSGIGELLETILTAGVMIEQEIIAY